MIILKTTAALQQHLQRLKAASQSIGFVPTMGALHRGHLQLVQQSRQQCAVTVVSIFVNPTQFNDPKDFEKYPVTIDKDCLLLEEKGADILFLPSVKEMYPEGTVQQQHYDLGALENKLEGQYRPGHFQGVCQVVHRLLQIVQPHQLFLGQKDFQQCMVIHRLIQLLQLPVTLVMVPTIREGDGLAMSSRNMRLSPEQRQVAPAIYRELLFIKNNYGGSQAGNLKNKAKENLLKAGFASIDYVEIAEAATLESVTDSKEARNAVALVAAYLGEIRLIDNLPLS